MTVLLNPTIKPRVFLFGACDLWDCVNIDLIRRDFAIDQWSLPDMRNDTLDIDTCQRPVHSTSLMSMYTDPGPIALRARETLEHIPNLTHQQHQVYKELVKYPYLKFFKENAGPKDILVMNFSSELYTKVYAGKERLTIQPIVTLVCNPADPLHWVYTDYIAKEANLVEFDREEMLGESRSLLQEFANDIRAIFGNRVVLVQTHISPLAINNGKVMLVPVTPELVPFYKPTKLASDSKDHSYAQRLATGVLRLFQKYYREDIPVASIKDSEVFTDMHHKWGYSPFHLHKSTAYKLGIAIHQHLVDLQTKIEKEQFNEPRII